MKKIIKRLLFIIVILAVFLGACIGYVAKTAYGIGYNKIYDKHLSSMKQGLTSKEIYLNDFDFICEEIKINYVNLKYKEDKFNFDWDVLCQKYRKEMDEAKSERDFFRISWSLLSNLHDGHLYFNYTGSEVAKKITNNKNSMFMNCIDIRFIEEKAIVVRSVNDFDILGNEVLSIEDIPFENIISTMVDNFDNSGNEISARVSIVGRKDYFRYFYYYADKYPDILHLKLKTKSGEIKSFEIDTNKSYDSNSFKTLNKLNFDLNSNEELPSHRIIDNIGYIHIPSFNGKPSDVVKSFNSAVQNLKNAKVQGTVIDIRYNGGGNQSFRDILGYLTQKEGNINKYRFKKSPRYNDIYFLREFYENIRSKSSSEKLDEGYTKWWSWKIEPNKEDFLRSTPTALLVNESIFSSSGDFANTCLNYKLTKVIGNIVPLSGNGLATSIMLPSRNYFIRYGFFEGRELDYEHMENVVKQPDIKSEQKLEDYYNGIDTQLKAAIDFIHSSTK